MLLATRNAQSARNRDVADGDRVEADQRRAAGARGERGGVIHAAAARADELFAIGKTSINSSNAGLYPLARSNPRVKATIRAEEEESPAAAGRSDAISASMPTRDARQERRGDAGGGAQVVLPIAARDRRQTRRSIRIRARRTSRETA